MGIMGRYRVQIVALLLVALLAACTAPRDPTSPDDSWTVIARWNKTTKSWEPLESRCFIIIDVVKFASAPDCGFPSYGTLSMNTRDKTFVVIDEIIEHRAVARGRYEIDGDTLTVNLANANQFERSFDPPRNIVPANGSNEIGWRFKRMGK